MQTPVPTKMLERQSFSMRCTAKLVRPPSFQASILRGSKSGAFSGRTHTPWQP